MQYFRTQQWQSSLDGHIAGHTITKNNIFFLAGISCDNVCAGLLGILKKPSVLITDGGCVAQLCMNLLCSSFAFPFVTIVP